MTIRLRRYLPAVMGIAVALGLSACAQSWTSRALVSPGKYDFTECPALKAQLEASERRIKQSEELYDKAGPAVGTLAYGSTLALERAEYAAQQESWASKNCGRR